LILLYIIKRYLHQTWAMLVTGMMGYAWL